MVKLAVLGATGRMGTRVLALAAESQRFEVVAALTCRDDERLGDSIAVGRRRLPVADTTDAAFDVLIDFSVPAGTMSWLNHCRNAKSAMVIGPTGYDEEQLERIASAATEIPIVQAANFSIGINTLLGLVGELARKLGDAYDIEIIEHHHNRKVDAPSGTASALCDAIVESTGRERDADVIYGRRGQTGARPRRQIGVHAVRMGDVVGRHEIHFSGPGETITLSHTAHSRDTFAQGALEAAAWIAAKPAGLYSMGDVLAASS